MLTLNIKKIPIYIINLKKDTAKLNQIQIDLTSNGYNNINVHEATYDKISTVGCASSHKSLLSSNIEPPYIVLEDDTRIIKNIHTITLPLDSDALYLGLSKWGYHDDTGTIKNSKHKNYIVFKNTEISGIVKLQNMLSAHSILYLSKDYVNHVIKVCNFFISIKDHFDKGIAESMKYYNIYGLEEPMFYQTSSKNSTLIDLLNPSINKKNI